MRPLPERDQRTDLILAGNEFVGLLESTPMPMLILDPSGTILAANAQTERLFGYGREFLIGKPLAVLLPDQPNQHPPGRPADLNGHDQARALELRGRAKDGSRFPIRVHLTPLDGSQGELVVAALRDLTEIRALEEQWQRSEAELEKERRRPRENDRFAGELLSALSAGLRPPLNVILALADALRKQQSASASAEHRQSLSAIVAGARRLLGFTARLGESGTKVKTDGGPASQIGDLLRRIARAKSVRRPAKSKRPPDGVAHGERASKPSLAGNSRDRTKRNPR